MGDSEEDICLSENTEPKTGTGKNASSLEIADVVKLMTGVLQTQFQNLSGQLKLEQSESIAKKLKENSVLKIKSEGNRAQYEFNAELLDGLDKLEARAFDNKDSESVTIIGDLRGKLKTRQKHIRIADSSPAGWKTVLEYKSREIADNSDDEKKIRSAENRALKHKKHGQNKRFHPYNNYKAQPAAAAGSAAQLALSGPSTVSPTFQPFPYQQQPFRDRTTRRQPQPSDLCHHCFRYGHCKTNCPRRNNPESQ